MNHEKIDRMKQEYEKIEVPEALKTQVEAGIRKGKRDTQKGSIRFLKGAATVAAAMVALVISVNVSPTIAHAMEEVPLLGTIVKVVNFSTYSDVQDDKNMEANVDIPQVAVTNQDGEVLSDETDELNQEVKKRHIRRLREGKCTIELGFILSDITTSFERVADHCSNIAVCVTQVREDTYDTHGYLNSVKNEDSEIFRGLVLEEEEKYLLP